MDPDIGKMLAEALSRMSDDPDIDQEQPSGNAMMLAKLMSSTDPSARLREVLAGGIANSGNANLLSEGNVLNGVGDAKPLSNLILEGDLAAEKARTAETTRQLVVAHMALELVSKALTEATEKVEGLTGDNELLNKRIADRDRELEETNEAYHQTRRDRIDYAMQSAQAERSAELLLWSLIAITQAPDASKGKRADLLTDINDVLAQHQSTLATQAAQAEEDNSAD